MVRNEDDIIDLWLEETKKWSDFMVIIDHLSDQQIATKLRDWCAVNSAIYLRYESNKYSQAALVNSVLKTIANKIPKHVVVIPIDSDEFISAKRIALILATLSKSPRTILKMYWRNAYPNSKSIKTEEVLSVDSNMHLCSQVSSTFKVCTTIGNIKEEGLRYSQGGHYLINPMGSFAESHSVSNVEMLHIPIRSEAQYENKISNGTRAYRAKNRFNIFERKLGLHWVILSEIPKEWRKDLFPVIVKNYGDSDLLGLSTILSQKDVQKMLEEEFLPFSIAAYLEQA